MKMGIGMATPSHMTSFLFVGGGKARRKIPKDKQGSRPVYLNPAWIGRVYWSKTSGRPGVEWCLVCAGIGSARAVRARKGGADTEIRAAPETTTEPRTWQAARAEFRKTCGGHASCIVNGSEAEEQARRICADLATFAETSLDVGKDTTAGDGQGEPPIAPHTRV